MTLIHDVGLCLVRVRVCSVLDVLTQPIDEHPLLNLMIRILKGQIDIEGGKAWLKSFET